MLIAQNKSESQKLFDLTDDFTFSRFTHFKARIFFLKEFESDYKFAFPYLQHSNKMVINDDNILQVKKQFILQGKSIEKFIKLFGETSNLKIEKYNSKIFNLLHLKEGGFKRIKGNQSDEQFASLNQKDSENFGKSLDYLFQKNFNYKSPYYDFNSQSIKQEIFKNENLLNSQKLFDFSDSFSKAEFNSTNQPSNLMFEFNDASDCFSSFNSNSMYFEFSQSPDMNVANHKSSKDMDRVKIENTQSNEIDNPHLSPFSSISRLSLAIKPISMNVNSTTINHSSQQHNNPSKHSSQLGSFVYSCFKTFQFNSPFMNQNMVHEAQHRQKTVYSEYEHFQRKLYLKNIDNNKIIKDFVHDIIDRNLSSQNLIPSSVEEQISTTEPIRAISHCSIESEKSLPSENSLAFEFVKSINLNKQKEIYSHNEILEKLNLKTLKFSEMPLNPIKIAEASFSEVFRIDDLIYKIIPFNEWYGIESFSKETFILECLKNETSICKLEDKFLLTGSFTKVYLEAWEQFKGSENINPSEYKEDQIYGVLVMQDCGIDLEKYQFENQYQFFDFIDQLLSVICKLENKFKFEHRDMHWGNIMIKDSQLFLVDFNFSRLEIDKIVYTDLNEHEWIFEGDRGADIQFGVYKEIRESCKSNWLAFNPESNLFWIRYLLQKLILKANKLKTARCKTKTLSKLKKILRIAGKSSTTQELYDWFIDYDEK